MKLSMIAAMAKGRVIGKDNSMPWHLPADFTWFKRQTLEKPILMGRKTFESIGRPLPHRRNIVITRDSQWYHEGVEIVDNIDSALSLVAQEEEVMIIGGGSIYQACLPLANRLYITHINADIEGDTCFPDWGEGWKTIATEKYKADEKNAYDMEFVILER